MIKTGFVWPGIKKITLEEAGKRIKEGEDVYELFDNNKYAKIDSITYGENKKYGIMYDNNFSLEEHFFNEKAITGRVLFCGFTKDIRVKLKVAYIWLEYIADKLNKKEQKKCRFFLKKIKYLIKKTEKNNYSIKFAEKRMIKLWDEVQIFLQEICPTNWYFIKQDNETYVFVYITWD